MTRQARAVTAATALLSGLVLAAPVHAAPAGARYEAENATIFHGTVDHDHTGFTGTGFVNGANEIGSSVEWTVTTTTAPVTLVFRYANGTTGERPATVTVDGTAAGTPIFA